MKNTFFGFLLCVAGTALGQNWCEATPRPTVEGGWHACLSTPNVIEVLGSDFWQNENGGGVLFLMPDMPIVPRHTPPEDEDDYDTIAVFLIRPTDSALEMMASQLARARDSDAEIMVYFRQEDPNLSIANVASIQFLKPEGCGN